MELIISKNTKAINTDIALAPKNLKSVPSGECLIGIEHGGSSGKSGGYSYEPLISALTKKYNNIEILWASTREAYNFIQAKQMKCNIITMPPKVINQINSFGKSYKALTLDTVKGFLTDSKKSKFKI